MDLGPDCCLSTLQSCSASTCLISHSSLWDRDGRDTENVLLPFRELSHSGEVKSRMYISQESVVAAERPRVVRAVVRGEVHQ